MKLKILFFIVLLITQFKVVSQKKVELVFTDKKKMTISDVNALINNKYQTSDKEGKIFVENNGDYLQIKATHLGYNTLDTTVNVTNNNYFSFELTFVNELPTVEIKSDQLINRSISKNIITAADIKRTFPLLGEKDPMKTLQMMPGVVFAQEGTASIYVRGGNPGENLILLDNVPLYNANHFFGLISTINPDIISSLEFFKGGFPAQYNDRVSSVIDIKTKEGGIDNTLKIGLLSSSLTLNRNFFYERLSLTASVRSSPLSSLVYGFNKLVESNSNSAELFNTYFYDFYSKANYKISNKTNLYISYFNGKDELLIKNFNNRTPSRDSTKLNWSNSIINAGIRSYLGFGLKNESNVYVSNYFLKNIDRSDLRNGELVRKYDYLNKIVDFGIKTRFTIPINFQTKFRIGGNYQRQLFDNNSISKTNVFSILKEEMIKSFNFKQDVLNAYMSVDGFLLGDKVKYDLGINHMSNLTTGKNQFEPRINSSFNLKKFSFLFSYHRLGQNTSLITPEAIGIPFQIWLPSKDKNNLISSMQNSLGAIYRMKNFEFSLEGYTKKVINLNYPGQGQDIRIVDPFSSEILKGGTLSSKGLEFLIKGYTSSNTIQFSYTLSRSLLSFDGYNKNNPFRQNIDRLHNANLSFEHILNKKWSFNAVVVYHSSYPITIPEVLIPSISYFSFANKSKFSFSELFLIDFKGNGVNSSLLWDTESVNNGQSRDYLRLDFNAKKTIRRKDEIKAELSFGIYNLSFRKNPFVSSITDNINGDIQNKLLLSTFSLFNFIPFVSYEKYF